jgi:hypothetical protein
MSHTKHLLFPRTVTAQVTDLDAKREYLKANAGRFGIPPAEISMIDTQVDAVIATHATASDPNTRSRLDIAIRNQAIRTTQITIRTVIVYYILHNPNATNVDFEALSIPRSHPHSHQSTPEEIPGIGHITSRELTVIIPFFDAQTSKHGKPEGVMAIEVSYKIGSAPPATPSEMTEHRIETASPIRLQFDYNEEMEVVYLVFRWIGLHGGYGPWSKIFKIAILR